MNENAWSRGIMHRTAKPRSAKAVEVHHKGAYVRITKKYMEMDSHNDGANVEEDDEGDVPQQVCVITKDIQSREERVSKDERGGEKRQKEQK